MTDAHLWELAEKARAAYDAMTPEQKDRHDYEQRRSFVRGMCSSRQDYEEWCKIVDRLMPPMPPIRHARRR
jgi:hypothetical protein